MSFVLLLLLLIAGAVLLYRQSSTIPEPEPFTGTGLPPLPADTAKFSWVKLPKWVSFYYGAYNSYVSGKPYPPWPNPSDKLLSNTQAAAVDPVHAYKLEQQNEIERRCAVSGKCVQTETAAAISAIWKSKLPAETVAKLYATPDASLVPARLT